MKKTRFLFAFIMLFVLLCGCQTYYEYEFEQSIEQVSQVHIVTEEGGIEIQKKCDIGILKDIQLLKCQKYWNDPPHEITTPYVLVEYNNGANEKICAMSNCYEIDGKTDFDWEYFNSDEFFAVLEKYQ